MRHKAISKPQILRCRRPCVPPFHVHGGLRRLASGVLKWLLGSLVAFGGSCFVTLDAWAQDSRDAEIFGETPPAQVAPGAVSAAEPAPSLSPVPASLFDSLQVGGRAELKASTGLQENQKLSRARADMLKRASLYFDSRPNDDVRTFLRFRLSESQNAAPSGVRSDLEELWIKWNWDDALFFTAGKQRLKWGSGRFWNPTDFTAKETLDPFALFDDRLGQTLVKIHVPVEKQGFNYYGVVQVEGAQRNEDVGGALRGEFAFLGSGELALTFQTRRAQPLNFGVDVSSAVGPVDVHVETAVSKRHRRTFFRGDVDPATGRLPEAYSAEKRWFSQSVVGVDRTWKYSDEDVVTFGVEYLFNELGYEDKELGVYSLLLGESKPLYAGRHYAAGFVRLPTPGDWNKSSFFLNSVQNISDATNITRLTATWTFFNELTLEAYGSRCFGDAGELCFRLPSEYLLASRAPGIPLEQRRALLALPTRRTLVSAGLGASIQF